MANRLAKRGKTTYVPAVASQPAVPAYCVVSPSQATEKTSGPRLSAGDSKKSSYTSGGQTAQAIGGGYQSTFETGYYGLAVKQTGEVNPVTGQLEVELATDIVVPAPSQQ